MGEPERDIEAMALALPREQRERLAERLWSSLDDQPLTDEDRAVIAEAERRYEEYKSGKAEGIPGGQFTDQIRRELGWNR